MKEICNHYDTNGDKCAHIAWRNVLVSYEGRQYTQDLCHYHTIELVAKQIPDATSILIRGLE